MTAPIDPTRSINPINQAEMEGVSNVTNTPVQQPTQIPPDQTVVGGAHGHAHAGKAHDPALQAPAAVGGHQKSWASHFRHMQNPAVIVVKKHVKAEMKRVSKEEKKIQESRIKEKEKRQSDQQGQQQKKKESEEEEKT